MNIGLDAERVVDLVERSIVDLAEGRATNPPKVAIKPAAKTMAIAMVGHTPASGVFGFKNYNEAPTQSGIRVASTITLVADRTGLPCAFMDGEWITAARTGAVTGLFARHAALGARTALIIGSGQQARATVPALIATVPEVKEILIHSCRRQPVEAICAEFSRLPGDCTVAYTDDPAQAARHADILVAASGDGTPNHVSYDMLKKGALAVWVGHGIAPDVLHRADRVLATSEAQMQVTGTDLLDGRNRLPDVDAELPEILAGRKSARLRDDDIVAAYNSGLTVTDIAVAAEVYQTARERALGSLVVGF